MKPAEPQKPEVKPEAKAEEHQASASQQRAIRTFLNTLSTHTDATSQQIADVDAAMKKAMAAGVPWLQILFTLLPFVLQIFTGGTIDIQALIAAILALITPPKP